MLRLKEPFLENSVGARMVHLGEQLFLSSRQVHPLSEKKKKWANISESHDCKPISTVTFQKCYCECLSRWHHSLCIIKPQPFLLVGPTALIGSLVSFFSIFFHYKQAVSKLCHFSLNYVFNSQMFLSDRTSKTLVQALIFCFYPNYLLHYSSSLLASHIFISPFSLYNPLQLRNICRAFQSDPVYLSHTLNPSIPWLWYLSSFPPFQSFALLIYSSWPLLHILPTTLAAIPALTADSLFLRQTNNGLFLATLF